MLCSLLFRLMRGLGPDAALEIEIFFARREDLAKPGSGQQLKTHRICGPRVRMLVEDPAKPPKSPPPRSRQDSIPRNAPDREAEAARRFHPPPLTGEPPGRGCPAGSCAGPERLFIADFRVRLFRDRRSKSLK